MLLSFAFDRFCGSTCCCHISMRMTRHIYICRCILVKKNVYLQEKICDLFCEIAMAYENAKELRHFSLIVPKSASTGSLAALWGPTCCPHISMYMFAIIKCSTPILRQMTRTFRIKYATYSAKRNNSTNRQILGSGSGHFFRPKNVVFWT